jgi:hypothetical protein
VLDWRDTRTEASAGASSIGCVSCGSPFNASRSACIKIAPSQIGAMASATRKTKFAAALGYGGPSRPCR